MKPVREPGALYIVLTGDIVSSRSVPDRAALQRKLRRLLARLSESYSEIAAVPLSVSGGDEFQGLLEVDARVLALAGDLERGLYPVMVRLGIGIGTVSTGFEERAQEMDGEAFAFSREAVEKAREKGAQLWFRTSDPAFDLSANTIALLIGAVKGRWKAVHRRRADMTERGWTQARIAKHEGVAQSAVSSSLRRVGFPAVRVAEENLAELFRQAWDITP